MNFCRISEREQSRKAPGEEKVEISKYKDKMDKSTAESEKENSCNSCKGMLMSPNVFIHHVIHVQGPPRALRS